MTSTGNKFHESSQFTSHLIGLYIIFTEINHQVFRSYGFAIVYFFDSLFKSDYFETKCGSCLDCSYILSLIYYNEKDWTYLIKNLV